MKSQLGIQNGKLLLLQHSLGSLDKPDFDWLTGPVDNLIDEGEVLGIVVLQLVVLKQTHQYQVDLQGGKPTTNAHPSP